MKKIQSLSIPSLLFIASLFFGVSCEKKGPAEEAGERIDDKMEEAGDKMEDAADKVEDKLDDSNN
jgi:hypothetical protein